MRDVPHSLTRFAYPRRRVLNFERPPIDCYDSFVDLRPSATVDNGLAVVPIADVPIADVHANDGLRITLLPGNHARDQPRQTVGVGCTAGRWEGSQPIYLLGTVNGELHAIPLEDAVEIGAPGLACLHAGCTAAEIEARAAIQAAGVQGAGAKSGALAQ